MRDLCDAEWEKGEDESGDERGGAEAGLFTEKIPNEEVHPNARQRKRRDEQQVVGEDQISGQPVHRDDLHDLSEEMFRKGQRERFRVKDVGVPVIGEADLPGQQPRHVFGAPSKNPQVEQ